MIRLGLAVITKACGGIRPVLTFTTWKLAFTTVEKFTASEKAMARSLLR